MRRCFPRKCSQWKVRVKAWIYGTKQVTDVRKWHHGMAGILMRIHMMEAMLRSVMSACQKLQNLDFLWWLCKCCDVFMCLLNACLLLWNHIPFPSGSQLGLHVNSSVKFWSIFIRVDNSQKLPRNTKDWWSWAEVTSLYCSRSYNPRNNGDW